MTSQELIGKRHRKVLDSLLKEWWPAGPPVCFLEGFPGVGKTNAILPRLRRALADRQVKTVAVEVPQPGGAQFADLLLDLAQELARIGVDDLAEAVDRSGEAREVAGALLKAFQRPTLVVWDEFQRLLGGSGTPVEPVLSFLTRLGRHVDWPGRLLLLTNQTARRGHWSDPHRFETLPTLDAADGRALLDRLLETTHRELEIELERREEVVAWVGGNPRALQLLVAALAAEPLENLIGLAPEAWELRHREVSRQLLEDLERELLRKVVEDLEPPARTLLIRSSILRKPVKQEALDDLTPPESDPEQLRRALASRFLVGHDRGWYSFNAVAREVARNLLAGLPAEWRRAHSVAADHYARHFRAARIVGGGRLGGHFVEARYHLVQAGREGELGEIVHRFEAHLRNEIKATTRVPSDPEHLDERIATLSALLEKEGPKGLEYHLARCLATRRRGRDLERGVQHIRRATGPQAPVDAWFLRAELEGELGGADPALAVIREGLRWVSRERGASVLYQKGAELLHVAGRAGEALGLLRDGIGKVPPDKSLFSLYQAAAEILAEQQHPEEAVELLRDGIRKVPPDQNLFSLYQAAAEILAEQQRPDEAVELLRDGIRKVPPEKGLFSLYQAAAEILAEQQRPEEAVELLRDGIRKVPPEKSLVSLYQAAGELLSRTGQVDAAVELLKDGLATIPRDKARHRLGESALYISLGARRSDLISQLASGGGGETLDPQQIALAEVLGLQLSEEWAEAASRAREARVEFPRYLQLAVQESFCWLAAGRPTEASAVLASFPFQHGQGVPSAWLGSFVALRRGDREGGRELLSIYLGHPSEEVEEVDERTLLELWDSPVAFSTPHPSFYHSILPPSLTGLDHSITRPPTKEPVLPRSVELTEKMPRARDRVKGLQVLAVATEWSSRHGGLSTFNRELCIALAACGNRVACLVPAATSEERSAAVAAGVALLEAAQLVGDDPLRALYRRSRLPDGFEPDLVIGHGRITGPAARTQVEDSFPSALRLHFVHMAPGEIEWHKAEDGAAARSEHRERQELELSRGAALVVAVGPRLTREIGNLLAADENAPQLIRMDPGLRRAGGSPAPPAGLHVLVLGRAEDLELKGLDIAAAAMAQVPSAESLPLEAQPVLVVRGAPAGTGDSLRRTLKEIGGRPGLEIRVREYTPQADRIAEDLRRASLVLMPSRTEGFGLIGLEAIAAGVPVLVSNQSGLGELLFEKLGDQARLFVVPTSGELEKDAPMWAQAIEDRLRDRKAAFDRAVLLREQLSEVLRWDDAVARLLAALPLAEVG